MRCKYWDCGWCYAPDGKQKNDNNGRCDKPDECEELERQDEQHSGVPASQSPARIPAHTKG